MSMSEGKKKFISVAVTLAGVICLPQMLISSGKGLDFSNSFLSVLVFLLCFPVIHRSLWNGARSIWSFLMSLVLVTACCLGSRLEALGYVWLTDWHMSVSYTHLAGPAHLGGRLSGAECDGAHSEYCGSDSDYCRIFLWKALR